MLQGALLRAARASSRMLAINRRQHSRTLRRGRRRPSARSRIKGTSSTTGRLTGRRVHVCCRRGTYCAGPCVLPGPNFGLSLERDHPFSFRLRGRHTIPKFTFTLSSPHSNLSNFDRFIGKRYRFYNIKLVPLNPPQFI